MEGASFLTGYTPRRGWFEEKARRRDEREAARVTRTRREGREEREMIIHSTVITQRGTVKLTRQEIRPTERPPTHPLPRLASSRVVPLSAPSFPNLPSPPSKTSKRPTYPWLYANHRPPGPVINLLNYITRTRLSLSASYKSTIFPPATSAQPSPSPSPPFN